MVNARPLLVAALLLGAHVAVAQTPSPAAKPADIVAAVAASSVELDENAANIDDDMQAYIDASGLGARERLHEISVLRGTATVQVRSENPDWIQQRSLAYTEALLNAQADYVKNQRTVNTNDTVATMFKAAGQEPPPYDNADKDNGKTADLLRKLVGLASGKLDQELRELNIDPKQFEAMSEPQRHVQLQNKLSVRSTEKSFGELVGLTPTQTFERNDGKGNCTIGVVAVVSPALKEFAQQVLKQRGEFLPDPTRVQDIAKIYASKPALVRDFGVRRMFDEQGLPVIVSFAQWSSSYLGGDPVLAEEYRRAAREQAEQMADAQITDFLKGSIEFTRTSETGRTLEEAAERMQDGSVIQEAATRTLLDAMAKTIRRQSSATLTGLQTLARWSLVHPDAPSQHIIGVIRMWSAAGEKATRALHDGRAAAPARASAEPAPATAPTVKTGRSLMDASDF